MYLCFVFLILVYFRSYVDASILGCRSTNKQPVKTENVPYLLSLERLKDNVYVHYCAAAIVHHTWAITSVYCVTDGEGCTFDDDNGNGDRSVYRLRGGYHPPNGGHGGNGGPGAHDRRGGSDKGSGGLRDTSGLDGGGGDSNGDHGGSDGGLNWDGDYGGSDVHGGQGDSGGYNGGGDGVYWGGDYGRPDGYGGLGYWSSNGYGGLSGSDVDDGSWSGVYGGPGGNGGYGGPGGNGGYGGRDGNGGYGGRGGNGEYGGPGGNGGYSGRGGNGEYGGRGGNGGYGGRDGNGGYSGPGGNGGYGGRGGNGEYGDPGGNGGYGGRDGNGSYGGRGDNGEYGGPGGNGGYGGRDGNGGYGGRDGNGGYGNSSGNGGYGDPDGYDGGYDVRGGVTLRIVNPLMLKEKEIRVRSGSRHKGTGGTVHLVEKIITHPEYNPFNKDNAVSIIKVSTPFSYGDVVQRILMSTQPPDFWTRGIVSGWGGSSAIASQELQKVEVTINDYELCKERFPMVPRMLCVVEDVCIGDAGGPLVVDGRLTGINLCEWTCHGPGVYTEVSSIRNWVTGAIVGASL